MWKALWTHLPAAWLRPLKDRVGRGRELDHFVLVLVQEADPQPVDAAAVLSGAPPAGGRGDGEPGRPPPHSPVSRVGREAEGWASLRLDEGRAPLRRRWGGLAGESGGGAWA